MPLCPRKVSTYQECNHRTRDYTYRDANDSHIYTITSRSLFTAGDLSIPYHVRPSTYLETCPAVVGSDTSPGRSHSSGTSHLPASTDTDTHD